MTSLDDLTNEEDVEAFETALYDACAEGFHADRRLPNGMTLAELTQGELNVLQEHASTQIGALAAKAGELGVDVVLLFLAIRGDSRAIGGGARQNGPPSSTSSSRCCATRPTSGGAQGTVNSR